MNPANQPIYSPVYSDNDNGLNTPGDIVNFLGCVPHPQAHSLQVNNVVWSLADGPDNPNTQYPWTGLSRVGCHTAPVFPWIARRPASRHYGAMAYTPASRPSGFHARRVRRNVIAVFRAGRPRPFPLLF